VGVDDQWHSGASLLLCSVARCLGVGTCSQADYPGMFGCICGRERDKRYVRRLVGVWPVAYVWVILVVLTRGFVVSSRGCGSLCVWPVSRVGVE
jgi:hypothetical protein